MIVVKFGGTSVQDSYSMDQTLSIAESFLDQAPLLISSAMSGVTNNLIELTQVIEHKDPLAAEEIMKALETRHLKTLETFCKGDSLLVGQKLLAEIFQEIRALVKGSLLLRECSLRVYDALVSMGEHLSTRILYARALEKGLSVELLDSRRLIITDEQFGNASVDWPLTQERVQGGVKPRAGHLIIAQGFMGATPGGVTTILGRGGSDYSATIFGSCLDAEEVMIWTDVDGIMTTDPRKVPEARPIPVITYQEAAEMAYFGAKVVHPATIQPAVEKGIPVSVRNTKNPTHPGTLICSTAQGKGLRAISTKKKVTMITVTSSRMLNAYGFLFRIFEVFHKFKTPVDLVATSEVSVSMTIEDSKDLKSIKQSLEDYGTVKIEAQCGILCCVGQELWKDTVFLQRLFKVIPHISIKLISLGSSEINLSLVVEEGQVDDAVIRIHKEFFPE